jgi:PIN domain nuclease of toxin-antitoxin system
MQAILDTHALLWWLADDPALTQSARTLIGEMKNVIYVSAAAAWEIATKVRFGKLPSAVDLASDFTSFLERERFQILPISAEHAIRAGRCRERTKIHLIACSLLKRKPRTCLSSVTRKYWTLMAYAASGDTDKRP